MRTRTATQIKKMGRKVSADALEKMLQEVDTMDRREYMRAYRMKNKERIKLLKKEYRKKHKEKDRKEYMRAYREKNREKYRLYMKEYNKSRKK